MASALGQQQTEITPGSARFHATVGDMQRLVLVTGPPSAGKTTLAASLSAQLELPLLSKDHFKERLAHIESSVDDPRDRSRLLSDLAWEHLFEAARRSTEALIEGNVPIELKEHVISLHPRPVEIFCRVPLEVLEARLGGRDDRHHVHDDEALLEELRRGDVRGAEPLSIGPVLEVATDQPVDVSELAGRLRSMLG